MELPKRKPGIFDFILILLLAAVFAAASFRLASFQRASGFTVTSQESTETVSMAGGGTRELTSNGISVVIRWDDDGVYIQSSSCPDGTCMKTGRISRPGESIVCVPAKLSITIPSDESEDEDEVYFVG